MAKSLIKTSFDELHSVFGYKTNFDFEKKKARLFPTTMKTNDEAATTSIFLSSLSAVKEYREELLFEKDDLSKMNVLRRIISPMGTMDGIEFLIAKLKNTKNNADFFDSMNKSAN